MPAETRQPVACAITIDGFVIVPPVPKSDEKNRDSIYAFFGPSCFGRTEAEAWRRWHYRGSTPADFSQHVQHWFDRGYRVKAAKMEIYP